MAFKETKRKGFNFFRSYYDVFNELPKTDQLAFITALLDRQFQGIKPTNLKGMAKFAWISQVNSIDSQVKGFEDKTGVTLHPRQGGVIRGENTPTLQVEGKEKEKVEDNKIDFSKLLISYNTIYSKKTRVINTSVKTKYNKLLKEGYTKADIHQSMLNAKQDEFHKECKLKHLTLEYFSRPKTMDLYAFLTTKQINKPVETENPYQKEDPNFFKRQ